MIALNRRDLLLGLAFWVFIIEASTFYVRSNTIDNIFQFFVCLLMLFLVLVKGCRRQIVISRVLILYLLLVSSALVHDLVAWDMTGLREGAARFLLLAVLFYMDNTLTLDRGIPDSLFVIPVLYGGFISIQGMILQTMNFLGMPVLTKRVVMEKFQVSYDMEIHGLGVVMYNGGRFLGRDMLRIYGHFIEPAKMAAFLLIPIFFSWGLYQKSGKKFYKYMMMLCLAGLLLTFSRAGLVALIGALVIRKIVGKRTRSLNEKEASHYPVTGRKDLIKLVVAAAVFLIAAILALNLLVALAKFFPEFRILYHGITNEQGKVNLIRKEGADISYVARLIKDRPLGYGFSGNSSVHTNLANAFIYWLICGGLPGAVLVLILFGYFMLKFAVPALKSTDPLQTAVACAFLALTIQNLSYGKWADVDFLFLAGLLAAGKRVNSKECYKNIRKEQMDEEPYNQDIRSNTGIQQQPFY